MYGLNDGEGDFAHVATCRDLYNAQWRSIAELRGTDTMAPPASLAGSAFPIPRSTNADVLRLVDYWVEALAAAGNPPTHWQRVVDDVARLAKPAFPSAVYANNNELWHMLQNVARPQLAITRRTLAAA